MKKATRNYLAALEILELTPFGKDTATTLGLKMRQLANLAAGRSIPTPTLWRLIEALIALKTI